MFVAVMAQQIPGIPSQEPNRDQQQVPDPAEGPQIESFSDFTSYLTDRFLGYFESAVALAPRLIIVLIVLLLTWFLARAIRAGAGFVSRRAGVRRALVELTKTLAGVLVWVIGGFMAMTVIFPSLNPGSIVAGLGVGGIIIGIAFKDIFQNFMAGVMILLRRSMRIGDYIESDEVEGRIERINLRDTYLRRTDGELVIVPNSRLFENPVHVWTDPTYRRYDIVVGVAYGEDVGQSRRVIEEALGGLDFGSGKDPEVYACAFNSSSLDFTVRWWAGPEPLDMHRSRDKVVDAVKSALDRAGIEIPFPYRTLTFKEPLSIRGREAEGVAAE